jgi:hypothetical protein
MKKIIGIIFISLMFANIGLAEMKLIEEKAVASTEANRYFPLTTFCIDGYKVLIYQDIKTSTSMVQLYEERDGKSLPTKC